MSIKTLRQQGTKLVPIKENSACDETRRAIVLQQLVSHIKSSWKAYGIPYTHQHLFTRKYFEVKPTAEVYAALMEEADALVREESVVQFVTKAIGYREFLLRRLYQLEISASSVEDSLKKNIQDSLFEVLIELRNASIQVVEAVADWRQSVSVEPRKPRGSSAHSIEAEESFEHIVWLERDETAHPPRYRNYLLKLKTDTQWIHGSKLAELANFSSKCDPFFITPSIASKAECEGLSKNASPGVSKASASGGGLQAIRANRARHTDPTAKSPARAGVRSLLGNRGRGLSVTSAATVIKEVRSRRLPLTRTEVVRINEVELVLIEEAVIARARRFAVEHKMKNASTAVPFFAENQEMNSTDNVTGPNDGAINNEAIHLGMSSDDVFSREDEDLHQLEDGLEHSVHDEGAIVNSEDDMSDEERADEILEKNIENEPDFSQKEDSIAADTTYQTAYNNIDVVHQHLEVSEPAQVEDESDDDYGDDDFEAGSPFRTLPQQQYNIPDMAVHEVNSGQSLHVETPLFTNVNDLGKAADQSAEPTRMYPIDGSQAIASIASHELISLDAATAHLSVSDESLNALAKKMTHDLMITSSRDCQGNYIDVNTQLVHSKPATPLDNVAGSSLKEGLSGTQFNKEWCISPSENYESILRLQRGDGAAINQFFISHYWPRVDPDLQIACGPYDLWSEEGALAEDPEVKWFFIVRDEKPSNEGSRRFLSKAFEMASQLVPPASEITKSWISQCLPFEVGFVGDESVLEGENTKWYAENAHGLVVVRRTIESGQPIGRIIHLSMTGSLIQMVPNLQDIPSLNPPESYNGRTHLRHVLCTLRRAILLNSDVESVRVVVMCPPREEGSEIAPPINSAIEKVYSLHKHFRWFSLQQDAKGQRGQIKQAIRSGTVDPPKMDNCLDSYIFTE